MNLDLLSKLLGATASLAIIVGVIVAIWGVVVATQTLEETQQAASATLMLKVRDTLADDRYGKITDEIQDNDSSHALMKDHGGKFRDIDAEEYIGYFEDLGYQCRKTCLYRKWHTTIFLTMQKKRGATPIFAGSCKRRGKPTTALRPYPARCMAVSKISRKTTSQKSGSPARISITNEHRPPLCVG